MERETCQLPAGQNDYGHRILVHVVFSARSSVTPTPEDVGIYRVGTVPCRVNKDFRYNGRFKEISRTGFFVGGEVCFPIDEVSVSAVDAIHVRQAKGVARVDGFYRTVFGPAVAHSCVTYCRCDACFKLAFRRLTACRTLKDDDGNDIPAAEGPVLNPKYGSLEEELLHTNQERFFKTVMQPVFAELRHRYTPYFNTWTNVYDEAVEHHADPHIKKLLREHCMRELKDTGMISEDEWVKSVLIKLKTQEYAKENKYPRCIGDLGVAASLQGFRLTGYLKDAQSNERLYINGGCVQFVKSPDPEVLREAFQNLINPPLRFHYVYFSDDACYSVRTPEGVKMYNLDISTCDTSHGPAVFKALESVFPEFLQKDIHRLVRQCAKPARIVSNNKRHTVLLKPNGPVLYSGATITTAINNIANIAIAIAITGSSLSPVMAAREAGYVVTLQRCLIPEDLQFLKTSPVLDSKMEYHPFLNLGVLLRLSGACKGDLPGSGDLVKRARAFQGSLVNGFMTTYRCELLDTLRARFPIRKDYPIDDVYAEKMKVTRELHFPMSHILKRYRLESSMEAEVMLFSNMDIGQVIGNAGLSKILSTDYGVSCNSTHLGDYNCYLQV